MTDTATLILNKLIKQRREEGKLPLLLDFYQKLLELQVTLKKRLPPPTRLNDADIKKKFEQGQPLVIYDDLNIDLTTARKALTEVTVIFSAYHGLFGEIPEALQSPQTSLMLTVEVVQAWYCGAELPRALLPGLNDNLKQTIVQAALQPFIEIHADAYKGLLKRDQMEIWRRGYCPVCSSKPDMAYLEKEVGARWLVCSRCSMEWLFQRLQCPFCGNQEQKSLSYFADDSDTYRLYVCEKCKRYLKAIDLRKAGDDVLMPLERLLTAEMDLQAREKGYSRGSNGNNSKL